MNKLYSPFLILTLLALTWGSSYILVKWGLLGFAPQQVAALRITISALFFLPVFLWRFRRVDWSRWKALLVVGLVGGALPALLFAIAQTRISSSLAGVLSSLTPLFTLLLGIGFFGMTFRLSKMIGVLLGLLGAFILILYGQGEGQLAKDWLFGSLVLLGCLLYAISSNTVKTFLQDLSSLTISSAAFVMVGPPALIFLLTTDFSVRLATQPQAWSSLGYIGILSLTGTVVASILFFKLVQMKDAVFASSVSYLIPLVALLWGASDGEQITIFHLLGMILILFGVYISRK